jgi:hypothetical protein
MNGGIAKLVEAAHVALPFAVAITLLYLAFGRGNARFWPAVAIILATVIFMSTSFGGDLSGLISSLTWGWLS